MGRLFPLKIPAEKLYSLVVMKMLIVLRQVLLLLLFSAAGYLLCKTKKADSSHAKLLSCLEIYVFLPCNAFNTFANNFTPAYLQERYPMLLASIALFLLLVLVSWPLATVLTKERYRQQVLRYSLVVSNYGYMGYALAGGLYGSEVLMSVMFFALPFTFFVYTVGYSILTGNRFSAKRLVNPVTLAMALGAVVGLTGLQVPEVIGSFMSKSVACLGPVGMLLTGMVMSEYRWSTLLRRWETYIVAFLRLLVIPCGAAAALLLLGMDWVVLPALLVLSMPCGMNAVVFGRLMGEDCESGASLALVTSLLSCVTIPFCLWLMGV